MRFSPRFMAYYLLFTALVLIVLGCIFYNKERYFSINSLEAKGEIVDIREDISIDKHSNATFYYHPYIQFKTAEGEEVMFESSASLNFQEYKLGEAVEVIYLAENPEKARIKGLGSPWLLPGILGGVGLLDLIFAFGLLIHLRFKKKRIVWLQQFGRRIKTKFKSIEGATRNKKQSPPYQIFSQGEENGQIYLFKSENLEFDPSSYLKKDQEITVFIDPEDIQKYFMDTSFLPSFKK